MSDFLSAAEGDSIAPYVPEEPAIGKTFGEGVTAYFRHENTIGSITNMADGALNTKVEGYDPWNDVKGTEFEAHWDTFRGSVNPKYTEDLKFRLRREMEDAKTIEQMPWYQGVPLAIAAGVLDPTVLLPGGGAVKAVKNGYAIGKSAGLTALAAAGAVSIQETALQATQAERTAGESAFNIGAGALLGGFLGGGVAAALNRSEKSAFLKAWEELNARGGQQLQDATPEEVGRAAAIGAQVADDITGLKQLESSGLGGKLGSRMAFMNPGLRLRNSLFVTGREAGEKLVGSTIYNNAMESGQTVGPSAFYQARSAFRSRMGASIETMEQLHSQMVQSGIAMKRSEFEKAVGTALWNGDVGANEFVSKAASAFRTQMIEPFTKEAIDLGMLPADVSPETAASYFMRVGNKELAVQFQNDFFERLLPHAEKSIKDAQEKATTRLANRTELLDRELAALQADPETRAQRLAAIDEQIGHLEDLFTDSTGRVQGGARREIAGLKRERQMLNLSVAGIQEKADDIELRLIDENEKMRRAVDGILKKGARMEAELKKLTPEKQDEWIQKFKDQFHKAAEQEYNAAKRAEKAAKAIDDEIAASEEKVKALNTAEAGTMQKAAAIQAEVAAKKAKLGPLREKLREYSKKAEQRSQQTDAMWAKLEEAYATDWDEFRKAFDEVKQAYLDRQADSLLAKGRRAAILEERFKKLTPEITDREIKLREAKKAKLKKEYDERWHAVDTRKAAEDMVEQYHTWFTGKDLTSDEFLNSPYFHIISRGPMRGRANWFPDSALAQPLANGQSFFEQNVVRVMDRFGRVMAAETSLQRTFGATNAKEVLERLNTELKDLRKYVSAAESVDEIYEAIGKKAPRGKDLETARQEVLKLINDNHTRTEKDVKALWDSVRGIYAAEQHASKWASVVRVLNGYNYVRMLGAAGLSNLPDLLRPGMVHGMGKYLGDVVPKLIAGGDGVKAVTKDLQKMGLVLEKLLHHRMLELTEVADPFRKSGPVENMIHNMATVASKWNGINLVTDIAEKAGGILSTDRIITAVNSGKTERLLAMLGVNERMRERIAKQLAAHGEEIEGIKVPGLEKWTDEDAQRVFSTAVYKDVTSIVPQRTPADVPLFAQTPLGQALFQFRTFSMVANQKVMLRGLDEGRANFISGLVAMTLLGMGVATLQALHGGKDRWEKFKKSAENPGFLVGEGLDRSGVIPLFVDASNFIGNATRAAGKEINPIKTPLTAMFPSATQQGDTTRFMQGGVLTQMLGPSAGLIEKLPPTLGSVRDGWTKREAKQALSFVPFLSYLGVRQIGQLLTDDMVGR